MNKKTILIVEDDPTNRLSLLSALRMRGFRAEAAADVTEARSWANKLRGQIDVMVLDMRLEDPKYDLTGADLGLEVRRANPKWPPEFLIFSGYKQIDYYEAALRLDAAAYLEKGTIEQEDLIRHIRSLALRRALSVERSEIAERIGQIAQRSHTPAAAVINFCRQLLAPEMVACLGVPFIFLLSDQQGTQNCGSDTDLPQGYAAAYETIQALAHGAVNYSAPFVFNPQHLSGPSDKQTYDIYQRLDGAAFLPLYIIHGLRLSVGILRQDESSKERLTEDPGKLASVLSEYLRTALLEHLLNVLSRLTEVNTRRETLLRQTASFCLYVGQEQLAILSESDTRGEAHLNDGVLRKLKALATDLRATGEHLSLLSEAVRSEVEGSAEVKPINASGVIHQAWREIKEQTSVGDILEERGENCLLAVAREDLLLAALRILQWMVQRADKTPAQLGQEILVEYITLPERVEISFTDRSRRLGENLRQKLFDPFTQITTASDLVGDSQRPGVHLPLYLAKMLVEVKHNGSLEDRTDTLATPHGHRFVMSFPVTERTTPEARVATSG